MFIARVNKREDQFTYTVGDIKEYQNQYKRQFLRKSSLGSHKFSILDLFRYKSLRGLTLMLIFVDIVFTLEYFTPVLLLGQFNFGIFINGAAIQSAQVFAAIFGYFTIYKLPRRLEGGVSNLILMICSIVLIFIWDQDQTEVTDIGSNIATLLLIFVI